MKDRKDRDVDATIHQLARSAIDEDALIELLETVSDEGYDAEAAEALRQVAAEDIVRYVLRAAVRARRRARILTAEDVADIAEGDGCCCECDGRRTDDVYASMELYYTKIDN